MLRLRTPAAVLFGLVLVLGACGDDGRDDYDDATREAFMEACTEDDTDPDLIEVCECTYETVVEELPFERYQTIERRLAEGQSDLPDDYSQIVVDCIREVSARRS